MHGSVPCTSAEVRGLAIHPVDDADQVSGSTQDRAVLLRATSPEGVFIGSHAVPEGRITRRGLADGPCSRVLHGVHADVSVPRDHLLRCRAAAPLMPPEAALGGRSAAAVLGAPAPGRRDPVTVVLPGTPDVAGTRGSPRAPHRPLGG